ncbi:unnamed protein product, partial [Ectocarpus sp. 12 AP-2014]
SRCVEKGVESECTYRKRRVRTCTPYRKKRGASLEAKGATELGTGHGESKDIVLKRYRFSASPATGLVGMQENVFLSNFFGSVGFLPLATRRYSTGSFYRVLRNVDYSTVCRTSCNQLWCLGSNGN